MTSYPVGLVGEAEYQGAITTARAGDVVHVVHERGNPHDPDALAVLTRDGYKIGYISRDSWLREALAEQGKGADAVIQSIGGPSGGCLGVVLTVSLTEGPLRSADFPAPPSKRGRNLAIAAGVLGLSGLLAFGALRERAAAPLVFTNQASGAGNPSHALLAGMDEGERRRWLAGFLTANGHSCARASRTFHQGRASGGEQIWNVRCVPGAEYGLMIEADREGSTTIARCAVLRQAGSPCWVRFTS